MPCPPPTTSAPCPAKPNRLLSSFCGVIEPPDHRARIRARAIVYWRPVMAETLFSGSLDAFDPLDARDGIPHAGLARLRAERPVHRTPAGVFYLALHEDVLAA